jgi:hypothetical protein
VLFLKKKNEKGKKKVKTSLPMTPLQCVTDSDALPFTFLKFQFHHTYY